MRRHAWACRRSPLLKPGCGAPVALSVRWHTWAARQLQGDKPLCVSEQTRHGLAGSMSGASDCGRAIALESANQSAKRDALESDL